MVGHDHNETDVESEEIFETPYSLLNHLSPKYGLSFSQALASKLSQLPSN